MPKFTVESKHGSNQLYCDGERIATNQNGDWKERYGTIEKWLKSIEKRETRRIEKIDETMKDLKKERSERFKLLSAIEGEKNGNC